jgi:hypothetical protein
MNVFFKILHFFPYSDEALLDITDVVSERIADVENQKASQSTEQSSSQNDNSVKYENNDERRAKYEFATKEFGFNAKFKVAVDIAFEIQDKVFNVTLH